tara:strand:+ start:2321 stop:3097 length:777 start_codon:yes stop_codon:yes gene_type:complete
MSNVIQFPAVKKDVLDGVEIQTVNLRDLHAFLEVATPFDKWVARRIEEYGFVAEHDFTTILSKSSGGRPSREFSGSIDMAKELSMVERNDKGKEARQYFISCERAAKQRVAPQSHEEITLASAQLLVQQKQRLDALERHSEAQVKEHENLAAKVSQIETNTRNGVPVGYISKSKSHKVYSRGLSRDVFEQLLTVLNVKTEPYVHTENDHSVYTFAWKESEIKSAVGYFIDNAVQSSPHMCSSQILNGKRFRFVKEKVA